MMTLDIDITGVGCISFMKKLPTRLLHILSCLGPFDLQRLKYMGLSLSYQLLHFVKFRPMVYGIQSASTPACIHEILIDVVTRGLQGVILGDHRFTTLVRGISFGLTNSATLLFASARHTSTTSLQLDDEGVFWRFPWALGWTVSDNNA